MQCVYMGLPAGLRPTDQRWMRVPMPAGLRPLIDQGSQTEVLGGSPFFSDLPVPPPPPLRRYSPPQGVTDAEPSEDLAWESRIIDLVLRSTTHAPHLEYRVARPRLDDLLGPLLIGVCRGGRWNHPDEGARRGSSQEPYRHHELHDGGE